MARLTLPAREDVPAESQRILKEIEGGMGRIPNLFLTYAPYPPLLRANWEKVKVALMEGELPRRVKETIALLVSQDNGCRYCVAAHSGALRQIGVDDDTIRTITEGRLKEADFDARERALIELMRAANARPHEVDENEFQAAR
ncbi:MAG: carboxymuconolactone decarboxylase family protein, partial [Halofilum sp. (in: g-proteobacteria)]